MNVYDFDGTIYRGDSTWDFFCFCLKKYPRTWFSLPRTALCALCFSLHLLSKTKFKENFYRFLRGVPNVRQAVEQFWDSHMEKIQPWYRQLRQSGDLVISASPEFLLKIPCERLEILPPIASKVEENTGVYQGVNCDGDEKVRRFRQQLGERAIQNFYSDSRSDAPLAELAEHSFLIRDGAVLPWPW